jgi:7,8-dihydropterin-6-yl-methyl-4-(beta-D-ribofuranosyl)aminobenzene 5'-phosphate synthase
MGKIILSTLCENTASSIEVLAAWGFSLLIEAGENKFLFDTGGLNGCCSYNANSLKKDLTQVKKIILSHGHLDHVGGIYPMLQSVNDPFARKVQHIEIIAHPDIWQSKYAKIDERYVYIGMPHNEEFLKSYGAKFILSSKPTWLTENIVTTGEIAMTTGYETVDDNILVNENGKFIQDSVADDQGLIIKTAKGLVIISGCAHRGIINMILHAQNITQEKRVYMVLGGTHLFNASRERIDRTIADLKKLNVQKIGVSHCTGLTASALMIQELGDKFFANVAGTCIVIDE